VIDVFDIRLTLFLSPIICVLLVLYFSRIALRVGLIDDPDHRKQHRNSVPLVGGLAIWTSLAVVALLFPVPVGDHRLLLLCLLIILMTGVLDDFRELSARVRIIIQMIIASALVYFGDTVVRSLGEVFFIAQPYGLGYAAIPFSIVAIVGTINAFNMIDGHDGLSGGLISVSLLALAGLSFLRADDHALALVVIVLTVLSFLWFNLGWAGERRRVFLGDAGSMSLGLLVGFLLIKLSAPEVGVVKVAAAPWLIALPLLDMFGVMGFRIKEGRSPFHSDRTHIHHLLLAQGWGKSKVLLVLLFTQVILASVGMVGSIRNWNDGLMIWGAFVILGGYFLLLSKLRSSAGRERR